MARPPAPAAFTLVELLVVIAVIGTLVALMLPAIQAAREAARRSQCASQLRQIAVAQAEYTALRGRLPPCGLAGLHHDAEFDVDVYDPHRGPKLSWAVLLLPYLEEQALADQFQLSVAAEFQPQGAPERLLAVMACPSDNAASRAFRHKVLTRDRSFAKGNYAAYCSPFHVDLQLLYRGALLHGGQPLAAVVDGTSHTMVFSEVRTLADEADERGVWTLPWSGASLLAFDMHPAGWRVDHDTGGDGYLADNHVSFDGNPESVGLTQRPNHPGPNADVLELCGGAQQDSAAQERMPCARWNRTLGPRGYLSAAPRSLHPGGVNAAWLDGRVAFLVDDVDDFAMAYAVSIDDGRGSDGG